MWQPVHIQVSWIEGNEDAECTKRTWSAGKRPAFPHPRFSLLFIKWSTGGMLRSICLVAVTEQIKAPFLV